MKRESLDTRHKGRRKMGGKKPEIESELKKAEKTLRSGSFFLAPPSSMTATPSPNGQHLLPQPPYSHNFSLKKNLRPTISSLNRFEKRHDLHNGLRFKQGVRIIPVST